MAHAFTRPPLCHTHKHTRACGLSLSLAEHGGVLKGQLSRPSGSHISRGCCVDIIISGLVAAKAKVICNLPNYLLQDDKTNERCVILPKSINISSCFFFLHTSSLVRLFLMQMGKLSLKCLGSQSFNYCLGLINWKESSFHFLFFFFILNNKEHKL